MIHHYNISEKEMPLAEKKKLCPQQMPSSLLLEILRTEQPQQRATVSAQRRWQKSRVMTEQISLSAAALKRDYISEDALQTD